MPRNLILPNTLTSPERVLHNQPTYLPERTIMLHNIAALAQRALMLVSCFALMMDVSYAAPVDTAEPASTATQVQVPQEWAEPLARATELVKRLSPAEKANLVTGLGWTVGPCVGNTPSVPSINFPGLCLQDSPTGIRFGDQTSAFPSSLNAAATWDRDLIRRYATAMGEEFRGKGVNVALSPVANMLRAPAGGRNWEGQGADPFLTSVSVAEQVKGLQSTNVIATVKHFILNEQEHSRDFYSAEVDVRTLHEVYLKPFDAAVKAGVGAVMCSYNRINSTYGCENTETMKLLHEDLGFQGFTMSDWWAAKTTVGSANAIDMMMPGGRTFDDTTSLWGPALLDAVSKGQVKQERVDDMCKRVLAAWLKMGQDKNFPATNFNSWDPSKSQGIDVQADHKKVIREVGAASTVLVKNEKQALPLVGGKYRKVAVIGEDARGPKSGNPNAFADRGGVDGTVAQGWGSGTSNFPYLVSPLEALQARAPAYGIQVVQSTDSNGNIADALRVSKEADVSIVFGASNSGEEYITVDGNKGDRNNLTLWSGADNLISQVASQGQTIVVLHSPGAVVDTPWQSHPNVTAILYALFPGQESGNALTDVLLAETNPSGRLPFTVNPKRADYPADIIYNPPNAPGKSYPVLTYTEGLYMDYKWNDLKNIQPLYAFGHGLSYTSFAYSGFKLAVNTQDTASPLKIDFTLKNTGTMDGHEVAQVYVGLPSANIKGGAPKKILAGFEKVLVPKGEEKAVSVSVGLRELQYYDVESAAWVTPKGTFKVYVGASSVDLKWEGEFTM
ncbi:hypothetical protein HDV05_008473 [Chytridiales sp. JEL 0842]|nr:hypothetical protein HDV05_008473 [Chytridiales sp. JEL 0842]